MTLYISASIVKFWLSRVVLIVLISLIEHAIGLPIITLFSALLLAHSMSVVSRPVWLVGVGLLVATLYLLPFWLVIGVFLAMEFIVETVTFSWIKKELLLALLSVLGVCIIVVLQKMVVPSWTLLQLLLLCIVVVSMYQVQSRVGRGLGPSSWLDWYEKHRD